MARFAAEEGDGLLGHLGRPQNVMQGVDLEKAVRNPLELVIGFANPAGLSGYRSRIPVGELHGHVGAVFGQEPVSFRTRLTRHFHGTHPTS